MRERQAVAFKKGSSIGSYLVSRVFTFIACVSTGVLPAIGSGIASPSSTQAQAQSLGLVVETEPSTDRLQELRAAPNSAEISLHVLIDAKRSEYQRVPLVRLASWKDPSTSWGLQKEPEFSASADELTAFVGNHVDRPLGRVAFSDLVRDPRSFLARQEAWRSAKRSLMVRDETDVVIKTRAFILPNSKEAIRTIRLGVHGIHAVKGEPAMLAILATREGTSFAVLDNGRDPVPGDPKGQEIALHTRGARRPLRLGVSTSAAGRDSWEMDAGVEMMFVGLVPLLQSSSKMRGYGAGSFAAGCGREKSCNSAKPESLLGLFGGEHDELGGYSVERNPKYPIQVLILLFKTTPQPTLGVADLKIIKTAFDRLHGDTKLLARILSGPNPVRPQEYYDMRKRSKAWWARMKRRFLKETAYPPAVLDGKIRAVLGSNYEPRPASTLYVRDRLRKGGA